MAECSPRTAMERMRNIGVIAHIDAGKTTLTERLLFYTETIHRMGEVHDGNATMDFMPEEQERGITIASACVTCTWDGFQINIIDTPGHVDFIIEVERALRVLDGAVGVFCAVGGVEPQSETVWRQSEKYHVPKLAFINKIDRPGANFSRVVEEMRSRLGAKAAPVTIPLGEGDGFGAIGDVIRLERLEFGGDMGSSVVRQPLSGEEREQVLIWREKLLELLADEDEAIMEAYLAGETDALAADILDGALRKACIAGRATPVFAGSALRNVGVQPLLDGIVRYLPSPLEARPALGVPIEGEETQPVAPRPEDPLVALIFKVVLEAGRPLALARLYAGVLQAGTQARNTTQGIEERPARLFRLNASRREALECAGAGDIVAIAGLRAPRTGDTLCTRPRLVRLEKPELYRPVISLALEPRNAEEGKKLDEALERYCLEDPTLGVETDEATGQRILSGMGELHLEVLLERLGREYGIGPRSGNPQVILQETITRQASGSCLFERELGNVPHHGAVELQVAPLPRGSGVRIEFQLPVAPEKAKGTSGKNGRRDDTSFPAAWLDAVRQGIESGLQSGSAGGYPVQDISVQITALDRQEKSTPAGFHMAAVGALRQALEKAAPALLEPIMELEITTPEASLGNVMALLGTRGARVEALEARQDGREALHLVRARAPLRTLFGFSTALRSSSQGRGAFVMRFATFDLLSS